jgi:hypothetical protein
LCLSDCISAKVEIFFSPASNQLCPHKSKIPQIQNINSFKWIDTHTSEQWQTTNLYLFPFFGNQLNE